MLPLLQNQINSGFDNGDWLGMGITSATAAADPADLSIGLFDNAMFNLPSLEGVPLDSNSVIVAPALLGDANFDGIVNNADWLIVVNHLQTRQSSWTRGDFNDDGLVDGTDLAIVNSHMGETYSPDAGVGFPSGGPPVPEPTSLGLFLLPAALLLRRRWRTSG